MIISTGVSCDANIVNASLMLLFAAVGLDDAATASKYFVSTAYFAFVDDSFCFFELASSASFRLRSSSSRCFWSADSCSIRAFSAAAASIAFFLLLHPAADNSRIMHRRINLEEFRIAFIFLCFSLI
jgi:hypothetical protein